MAQIIEFPVSAALVSAKSNPKNFFDREPRRPSRAGGRAKAASSKRQIDSGTLSRVLDDLSVNCVDEVSRRTGVPIHDLLSHVVREWYNISFDVSAAHLRGAISQSKREASSWGA